MEGSPFRVLIFVAGSARAAAMAASRSSNECDHVSAANIMSDEEDRHVFMFIDLHKEDNHPSMFRKNYIDFVVMVALSY